MEKIPFLLILDGFTISETKIDFFKYGCRSQFLCCYFYNDAFNRLLMVILVSDVKCMVMLRKNPMAS